MPDGLIQDLPHDRIERYDPAHRHLMNLAIRVETRPKENLVGIDVPDAGNDLLMHQEGFEPPTALL